MSYSELEITSVLDEAGPLGAVALSILGFTALVHSPAAISVVPNGLVYTKSYAAIPENPLEFSLGPCGRMRSRSGNFSVTLGVYKEKGNLRYINLMLSVLGQDGNSSMEMVLNQDYIVRADRIMKDGELKGYENAGGEFTVPIPAAGIEFCYEITNSFETAENSSDGAANLDETILVDLNDPPEPEPEEEEADFDPQKIWDALGIVSSVKMHGLVNGAMQSAEGIISLPVDGIAVFPKFYGIGVEMRNLLIDWSEDSASAELSGLFPSIYGPAWKGIAATSFSLLFPMDGLGSKEDFLVFSAQGLMIDFDGKLSMNANVSKVERAADNQLLFDIHGELEVWENVPVRSSIKIWIDLDRGVRKLSEKAHKLSEEQNLKVKLEDHSNEVPKPPKARLVGFELRLLHVKVEEDQFAWGYELSFLGAREEGSANVLPAIPSSWMDEISLVLLPFLSVYLVYDGVKEKSGWSIAGGILAALAWAFDPYFISEYDYDVVPKPSLEFTQIGFRAVRYQWEGEEKLSADLILGGKVSLDFNSLFLSDFIAKAALLLGIADPSPVELFGESMDGVSLDGKLEMEFKRYSFELADPLSAPIKQLFKVKEKEIVLRDLPTMVVKDDNDPGKTSWFRPSFETRLVQRLHRGVAQHGLSIALTGLSFGELSISAPVKGLTLYFYPEFDLVLDFELVIPPEMIFLVPGCFMAKGRVELGKPLPALGGEQNYIGVELGLFANDPKLPKKEYLKYLELSNYEYQGRGQVIWGNATARHLEHEDPFNFWAVTGLLRFGEPILFPAPLGSKTFAFLIGGNIAPGRLGEGTQGLANWVSSLNNAGGASPLSRALRWDPETSESSWHPHKAFDAEDKKFISNFNLGALMEVVSMPDKGTLFSGEMLAMFGIGGPSSYLVLAGNLIQPTLQLKTQALVAIDADGFVVKLTIESKKREGDGHVWVMRFPIEIGITRGNKWLQLGHYQDEKGGPGTAKVLEKIFTASFYYLYSEEELSNFGINPFDSPSAITIPDPAIGVGLVNQLGPKKIGPSWLNIRAFAAMGINWGVSIQTTPSNRSDMLFFGEGFLGGELSAKVFGIKFALGMLARLQAVVNQYGYRAMGEIAVYFSLPWPLDDVRAGVDFILQSDDFLPLPPVVIELGINAFYRLEPKSVERNEAGKLIVPVDAVLGLEVSRQVQSELLEDENLMNPGQVPTSLALNDPDGVEHLVMEVTETEYQGVRYRVQISHQLENLRVALDGGEEIEAWQASWGLPQIDADGELTENRERYRTLFLNTLFPSPDQFTSQNLGRYHAWSTNRPQLSPCETFAPVCWSAIRPLPPVVEGEVWEASHSWAEFSMETREPLRDWDRMRIHNSGKLEWSIREEQEVLPLSLPYETNVEHSTAQKVELTLDFEIQLQPTLASRTDLEAPFLFQQLISQLQIATIHLERSDNQTRTVSLIATPPPLNGEGKAEVPLQLSLFSGDFDDSDFNDVEMNVIINANGRAVVKLTFEARFRSYFYRKFTVRGWAASFNGDGLDSYGDEVAEAMRLLRSSMRTCTLKFWNVCIERQAENAQWADPALWGDNNLPEDAVREVIDGMVMEPGENYRIDYAIRSSVEVYQLKNFTQGPQEELVADKTIITTSYGQEYADRVLGEDRRPEDYQEVPPLLFETEDRPSQDVQKYLGIHAPSQDDIPIYPDQVVPILLLKYSGLLETIYASYDQPPQGTNLLQPRLYWHNERTALELELSEIFQAESSGIDMYTNPVLESCAPEIDRLNQSFLFTYTKELETNSEYSLQLFNTGNRQDVLEEIPFAQPFHTSNYNSLSGHLREVSNTLRNADFYTLSDRDSSRAAIADLVVSALDDRIDSHDKLVESIYELGLGKEEPRCFPGQELGAVRIVSLSPEGNEETWGWLIEMTEPFLSKPGVSVQNSGADSVPEKGIYWVDRQWLLIQDLSASRLLIFKCTDAAALRNQQGAALQEVASGDLDPMQFEHDPRAEMWAMLQPFVAQNYSMLNPEKQQAKMEEIQTALEADENVSSRMRALTSQITLPQLP